MGRQAFVTGATGFVGRHLVDQLTSQGWQVRALVRSTSDTRHLASVGAELIPGDLRDTPTWGAAIESADTLFHLAAVTAGRTEREYADANAGGTRAVVAALAAAGSRPKRFVYLSSYAACGPSLPGEPRSWDIQPKPLTAYGRTKLAGEHIAKEAEGSGVEVVVIRAPAVYGPGDRALLPYFRLIRWNLAPLPTGGDRRLHLLFAPDLAVALRRAVDAPPATYAVAEPVEHRWADVIRVIASSMRRRPLRIPIPPSLVRTAAGIAENAGRLAGTAVPFNREKAEEILASAWICDLSGSELLLPPTDATPLPDGIDRTVRWYIRQGWL